MRYFYLLCCLGVTMMTDGMTNDVYAQSIDCPTQPTSQGAYLPCQVDVAPVPVIDTAGLTAMGYSACSGVEFHMIVGRDGAVNDDADVSMLVATSARKEH